MTVHDALDRLDEIHGTLARSEVYRGFRVPAVALVGAIGLVAAALQQYWPECAGGAGFVYYWLGVAGLGALIGLAAGLRAYLFREDEFARQRTRRVIAQFAPCLLVGGAVAGGAIRGGPEFIAFLPGIWAMVFGLGIVAVGPYLPTAVSAIGIGYVLAGAALILNANAGAAPSGWAVGGVFGIGHLITALALWQGGRNRDA